MLGKELVEWIIRKREFSLNEISKKFLIGSVELESILNLLLEEKIIVEGKEEFFIVLEYAYIFKNKLFNEIIPKIEYLLKSFDNLQDTEKNFISWDDIRDIESFVIFDGVEKIYEIHIKGKKVKLEGKEIMDYNTFRLRFFEVFGVMLETYKGIGSDWASLVSYWNNKYGVISKDKAEGVSDLEEAKEVIINYIENCSISDRHIFREGVVYVNDDCIFFPTKIIKKILKRNELKVSLRSLAYTLDDYIVSGSVPIKIENKSERFWKFKKSKFVLNETKQIKICEEDDS